MATSLSNHLFPSLQIRSSLPSLQSFSMIMSSPHSNFSSSRLSFGLHHHHQQQSELRCSSKETQQLDPKVGVPVYKPKSYEVLVNDAANSLVYALDQGKMRLEIEFPPLPTSMSSYKAQSTNEHKKTVSKTTAKKWPI